MSRELPTGLDTALNQVKVPLVVMVHLDWPGTPIYVWNGYYDLSWGGHTWTGLGHLGSVSEIQETTDLSANGCTLSLSGIPSALVSEALRNDSMGRAGKVYLGVLNTSGGFTVDPYVVFDGVIDVPSISDDGKTATIQVNLEKEFIDNRTAATRYTDQDQQFLFPGDRGLEFVVDIAERTFTWGKATIYPVNSEPEPDPEF